MGRIKLYYSLTKPGVLYGNALTAAAGFLFASGGLIDWGLFIALNLGTTLIIASACVLNNFLDQDIDSKMSRTKRRALVRGDIAGKNAVIFSIVLGLVGFIVLSLWTNYLVVAVGAIGYFDYVVLYGMLGKRLSIHGTLVGSISGAAPILAGYVAVTESIDAAGIILFLILFLWQMPEFYSIAIYRRKEYAAAKVPVMTVVKGVENTKIQIAAYTLLFVLSTLALSIYSQTSVTYFLVMSILGTYWIGLGVRGQYETNNDAWSRRMFKFSLIVLLVFCGLIAFDAWLA